MRRLDETSRAFFLQNNWHNKDKDIMSLPLATYYRRLHYEVMESDGVLWLGFKPGMVHAIVKEVWNEQPLNQTDAERY